MGVDTSAIGKKTGAWRVVLDRSIKVVTGAKGDFRRAAAIAAAAESSRIPAAE